MLNPGYRVIAKRDKMDSAPPRSFICPECKKICLEADEDVAQFRTKCSTCRRWVYGEKILASRSGRSTKKTLAPDAGAPSLSQRT